MGFANMHLHSNHSDGMLTIPELAALAKKENLGALVLTDHDVSSGYEDMKTAAESAGLETMTGVELAGVDDNNLGYHILSFDFDINNSVYTAFVDKQSNAKTEQTKTFFDYGVKNGTIKDITWREVEEYNKGVKWFCNNHVFSAMKAKNVITQEEYFPWWRLNFGPDAEGQKHIKHEYPHIEEIISVIHASGGVSVYAHPSITGPAEDRLSAVDVLIAMGVKGLEVNHPEVPEEDEKILREIALKHGLYTTGGTDHTGIFAGFDGTGKYGSSPLNERQVFNYASKDEYYAIKNRTLG